MNFLQNVFFGTAEIVIPMRPHGCASGCKAGRLGETGQPAFCQGDRLHWAAKGVSGWSILAVDVQTSCVQSSEKSLTGFVSRKAPRGAKLCCFALDGDRYGDGWMGGGSSAGDFIAGRVKRLRRVAVREDYPGPAKPGIHAQWAAWPVLCQMRQIVQSRMADSKYRPHPAFATDRKALTLFGRVCL